jgi:ABC-type Fe3+ transport system permease subunit
MRWCGSIRSPPQFSISSNRPSTDRGQYAGGDIGASLPGASFCLRRGRGGAPATPHWGLATVESSGGEIWERLGRAVAIAPPLVIALLALGVPLITLSRWLAIGGTRVWKTDEIASALGQTLLFGAIGATPATLAAAPIAWLVMRRPTRFGRAWEGLNYATSALPGIVVALALVTIAVRFARPLYQTVITVLLAYVMMFCRALSLASAPALPGAR